MKLSELIFKLQKILEEYGDKNVMMTIADIGGYDITWSYNFGAFYNPDYGYTKDDIILLGGSECTESHEYFQSDSNLLLKYKGKYVNNLKFAVSCLLSTLHKWKETASYVSKNEGLNEYDRGYLDAIDLSISEIKQQFRK